MGEIQIPLPYPSERSVILKKCIELLEATNTDVLEEYLPVLAIHAKIEKQQDQRGELRIA